MPRRRAARDVPPPRPVPSPTPAPPVEETGLGRAARAVADAVAGLVGAGEEHGGRRRPALGCRRPARRRRRGRRRRGRVRPAATTSRRRRAAAETRASGTPGALLGDLLSAVAPRLPIRDAARLRQAHPGASDEEIADALVARTARLTSAVGAAAGGLSAAHWLAPASLLVLPLELGAETVLVGASRWSWSGNCTSCTAARPRVTPAGARLAYLASWSAQRAADGSAHRRLRLAARHAGLGPCRAVTRELRPVGARRRPRSSSVRRSPAAATVARPRPWPGGCGRSAAGPFRS